jgi:hypothetical protein
MPGGQRFNPNQTNEQRRSYENLMLMCYDHHKITDNVEQFPVQRLKDMKKLHEQKFIDIAAKLQESINDLTALCEVSYSKCCKKINTVLNWGNSVDELIEVSRDINTYADKLKNLPKDTRKIFSIMIDRSTEVTFGAMVVLHEIEQVTGLRTVEMRQHYEMLHRYGFLSHIDDDDYGHPICFINELESGWPFWIYLKQFSEKTRITLEEIVVNLNFGLLD